MECYRERLTAPPSWWVAVVMFGGICGWIMIVAANPVWGLAAALVATGAAGALVWTYGGLTIRAGDEGLRVGNAFLPMDAIGAVTALDGVGIRACLGPDADARAWLRTRPYVESGVRVTVDDAHDPTPYWLISSRRPTAIVSALGRSVVQTESTRNEGTAG